MEIENFSYLYHIQLFKAKSRSLRIEESLKNKFALQAQEVQEVINEGHFYNQLVP